MCGSFLRNRNAYLLETILSALTDLQDAVTALSADVNALIAAFQAAAPGSISDTAGEAVVASLAALDAAVKAAVVPPAPPAA
jgi:hypothetical protein